MPKRLVDADEILKVLEGYTFASEQDYEDVVDAINSAKIETLEVNEGTSETNWVPTEDELVSLGFERSEDYVSKEFKDGVISFWNGVWKISGMRFTPKSLEELRSLISMMTP